MSERAQRQRPLVAVLWSFPLVAEALAEAIDFAQVVPFAVQGGDVGDLLCRLEPDAVVVDDEPAAMSAAAYAERQGVPVLQLSLRDRSLRMFDAGEWADVADGVDPEAATVRNVLAGALFARSSA